MKLLMTFALTTADCVTLFPQGEYFNPVNLFRSDLNLVCAHRRGVMVGKIISLDQLRLNTEFDPQWLPHNFA